MSKKKNSKKTVNEKKPFIKTRTKMDNSIEVELSQSPSKTLLGKILLYIIIAAMAILPIISLIYAMVKLI